MVLRNSRWLSAGVLAAVAMFAAPSSSRADTAILVQEIDGSSVVFSQTFLGSVSGVATPNFQVNIISPAATNSPVSASLTTSLGFQTGSSFDQNANARLEVTVTADGFTNPFGSGAAQVTNNAGASSGIGGTLAGGSSGIAGRTEVSSQTTILIGGNPQTPVATDSRPQAGTDSPTTTANVSSLPSTFSIQQLITIRATPINPGDQIGASQTLGGTASSVVSAAAAAPPAVPSPGGLVLALAAVPALGLRRALRRKMGAAVS